MKKQNSKLVSLCLILALLLSVTPVWAIEEAEQAVVPTPPSWINEEDYLVFEGDAIYQDQWADILAAREEVLSGTAKRGDDSSAFGRVYTDKLLGGGNSPAILYEAALLDIGQFLAGTSTKTGNAQRFFSYAAKGVGKDHPYYRTLTLWSLRCILLDGGLQKDSAYERSVRSFYLTELNNGAEQCGITLEELYNHPMMDRISQADREDTAAKLAQFQEDLVVERAEQAARDEAERLRLKIYLDGVELTHSDTQPCIVNDRTMVPIYELSQALGCDTSWDGATQTVTMTRAGDTVLLTIGSTTAYVNDQAVQMDVAPFLLQDRTMIPAAYVARFFGQSVEWVAETTTVQITENKSVVGESNMEAWALSMGSMLSYMNNQQMLVFGGWTRNSTQVNNCRKVHLGGSSWGIENREELIWTVLSMTVSGHNLSFLVDAAILDQLSPAEYQKLLDQATGMDAYMWPYTKQLSEKWGERGILCWDLFRMSNLVQWGYSAGYLTYAEALVLLEPAAILLCENFSSWDEAYENYLDGYNWWARNNVLDQDIWQTTRGGYYETIKGKYDTLFDDSLFETGVIPVPDLTIEDILATLE